MCFDIALILFSCVCANHLGLIGAIEGVIGYRIPIVNCPKCFSFWCTLSYCIINNTSIVHSLAIAFLIAYLSIWLELLMGFVDTLFWIAYEKVYSTRNKNYYDSSNGNYGNPSSTLSDLRRKETTSSSNKGRKK